MSIKKGYDKRHNPYCLFFLLLISVNPFNRDFSRSTILIFTGSLLLIKIFNCQVKLSIGLPSCRLVTFFFIIIRRSSSCFIIFSSYLPFSSVSFLLQISLLWLFLRVFSASAHKNITDIRVTPSSYRVPHFPSGFSLFCTYNITAVIYKKQSIFKNFIDV